MQLSHLRSKTYNQRVSAILISQNPSGAARSHSAVCGLLDRLEMGLTSGEIFSKTPSEPFMLTSPPSVSQGANRSWNYRRSVPDLSPLFGDAERIETKELDIYCHRSPYRCTHTLSPVFIGPIALQPSVWGGPWGQGTGPIFRE